MASDEEEVKEEEVVEDEGRGTAAGKDNSSL